MKPTDEERREVAAKLRAKHRERTRPGVFVPQDAGMQVWDYLRDLEACLPDGESAFTVLADLIDPEPEQTCRWVSVEESLPESAGKYIVAYHPRYCDCVNEAVTLIGMDSFRGKTAWAKRKHQRVTHWMPKPELPKMDEIGNVCIRVNVGVEPAEEFDTIARALGYAKERTCRAEVRHRDDEDMSWACLVCSACGEKLHYREIVTEYGEESCEMLPYCAGCGARVEGAGE